MPCFKGIAVSVHAEGAPLPEYSVQKQSRVSRVNTYIPVPKPRIPHHSDKLEPSKFAISITLLTPGLPVPYSQPKPTPDNPHPSSQIVSSLPGLTAPKGNPAGTISPYIPITKSCNETIAAYIYFDGRKKEEVATLLRPGEETWVNSRWVQVSDSDGGGLAEREFLFREVGLERWLNGLDLEGRDAAAKIEKRKKNFEMRRRRKKIESNNHDVVPAENSSNKYDSRGVLRYGEDERSPLEHITDDEFSLSSDLEDEGLPESAGQIKVAMFRVLASGEIKRGEYSPQFDAHDDEEDESKSANSEEGGIDHTTCFAKPKTLDPKSVSTQTVTGIDGPDSPFAVFTFFYRGERQLQKMGIISQKNLKNTTISSNRRSTQLDFSNLGPLKPGGTVGFSTFRENKPDTKQKKPREKSVDIITGSMMDNSDEDDDFPDILENSIDVDDRAVDLHIDQEDAKCAREIADGVGRIKLKRQHSAEPLNSNSRRSSGSKDTRSLKADLTYDSSKANSSFLKQPAKSFESNLSDKAAVGSPLKKHRASIHEIESSLTTGLPVEDSIRKQSDTMIAARSSQGAQITSDAKMEEEL
ncbi:hypothetical protein GcM1_250223 [Golovinomyces cichoracearum]|uniref:DUF7918 domain-containing protein n=1 Tax=Golovinomyces cichoracearum TaxID=62708 RepID=A0A420IBA0_9PEZI|nr:hypothetical protein GcM1_250223 [Golovinomyces cichoracearum]